MTKAPIIKIEHAPSSAEQFQPVIEISVFPASPDRAGAGKVRLLRLSNNSVQGVDLLSMLGLARCLKNNLSATKRKAIWTRCLKKSVDEDITPSLTVRFRDHNRFSAIQSSVISGGIVPENDWLSPTATIAIFMITGIFTDVFTFAFITQICHHGLTWI